jgi:hypothetical protein
MLAAVGMSRLAALTLQRKSTLPSSVLKSAYLHTPQPLDVSLRSGPALELAPLLHADQYTPQQLRCVLTRVWVQQQARRRVCRLHEYVEQPVAMPHSQDTQLGVWAHRDWPG